ncbi:MAG: hypothetical protein DRP85_00150 [Candidatus Makaraimicrobium thalassicum]|nr:MAG: hypothetical protein DRP85_00150 [Candidatus Omnitrophota bacterium]
MPRTDEVVRGFLFIRNGQRCPALKQLISLRSIKTARGAPLPVFSQAKSLAGQETGCKKNGAPYQSIVGGIWFGILFSQVVCLSGTGGWRMRISIDKQNQDIIMVM